MKITIVTWTTANVPDGTNLKDICLSHQTLPIICGEDSLPITGAEVTGSETVEVYEEED